MGLRHLSRTALTRIVPTALLALAGLTASPAALAAASPGQSAYALAAGMRADRVRADQWQLTELGATSAWRLSTGRGVTVAVIDSGVDDSHPDLAGQVLPGADLVGGAGDGRSDPVGHGTTVAGLIAGRADDNRGVEGLAPDAKILPVRVLDADNRYDDASIIASAIHWAVDHGAKVINLSLGGSGESGTLAAALDYAFARDVVVVACTGNRTPTGTKRVWYPAREPGVLAVTGLDGSSPRLWSRSVTGPQTVLAAPATGLLGARPGGFWRVQGTSFAAPLVAAAAALIRAKWPGMSAGDVINRLIRTADDLGATGRDSRFGYGRVDPVAALTRDVPRINRNPLDDGRYPAGGSGPTGAPPTVSARPDHPSVGKQAGPAPAGWTARAAGSGSPGGYLAGWAIAALLATAVGASLLRRRFRSRR